MADLDETTLARIRAAVDRGDELSAFDAKALLADRDHLAEQRNRLRLGLRSLRIAGLGVGLGKIPGLVIAREAGKFMTEDDHG